MKNDNISNAHIARDNNFNIIRICTWMKNDSISNTHITRDINFNIIKVSLLTDTVFIWQRLRKKEGVKS